MRTRATLSSGEASELFELFEANRPASRVGTVRATAAGAVRAMAGTDRRASVRSGPITRDSMCAGLSCPSPAVVGKCSRSRYDAHFASTGRCGYIMEEVSLLHINDGHVPDLVEVNGGPTGEDVINEVKVYTDLKKANTKGCATRAGASFRCDGHRFAFGNSEDKARVECLGRKQRGRVGDPPFNHNTGKGYIEGAKGYYHDALVNKKNKVNVTSVRDLPPLLSSSHSPSGALTQQPGAGLTGSRCCRTTLSN